jgi:hypothetical protein
MHFKGIVSQDFLDLSLLVLMDGYEDVLMPENVIFLKLFSLIIFKKDVSTRFLFYKSLVDLDDLPGSYVCTVGLLYTVML